MRHPAAVDAADPSAPGLPRRLLAEACGTAMLLIAVVGSGIMGERLAGGNVAVALLANSLATGGALLALLLSLAPVSGAHLNPAVTVSEAARGALPWRDVPAYLVAQISGAFGGVALAHAMFALPLFTPSSRARTGPGQVLSEAVATFGLLCVIRGTGRAWPRAVGFAVAAYITGAYWFTASTAFANPAVTLARAATDTFSGIRAADVPGFLLGQLAGAMTAAGVLRLLFPGPSPAVGPAPTKITEEVSP